MTQPKQSELEQMLDDVLAVFANYDESCEPGYEDVVLSRIERAKQAIKQLINAEVAKVLDTIESAVLGEVTDEEERYEVYTAIQAERVKLKEVK